MNGRKAVFFCPTSAKEPETKKPEAQETRDQRNPRGAEHEEEEAKSKKIANKKYK